MNCSAKFCGSKYKLYINSMIEVLMKIEVVKKYYIFRRTQKNFCIEFIWDLFFF